MIIPAHCSFVVFLYHSQLLLQFYFSLHTIINVSELFVLVSIKRRHLISNVSHSLVIKNINIFSLVYIKDF